MLVFPHIFGSGGSGDQSNIDFASPVYSQFGYGMTGIDDTYTAPYDQTVLVINTEIVGQAIGSHSSGATITTTGTVIDNDSHITDYVANTSRDCNFEISIIELSAGDTITLTNNHSVNYCSQIHLIFNVKTDITTLQNVLYETVIDAQKDNALAFTPQDDGMYILLAAQFGQPTAMSAATITGVSADSYYSMPYTDTGEAVFMGEYTLTTNDTATLHTAQITNYVSKLYGGWKIS